MVISGIYKITCKPNEKVYIGQSANILKRWQQHIDKFLGGKESFSQRGLQEDLQRYSLEQFKFEIIKICKEDELKGFEIAYINLYRSYNPEYGYNRLSDKCIKNENDRGKYWGSSHGLKLNSEG